ncbi:MAG: chemotaxis protein CheW [Gemmatimonadota bacterium]
MNGSAAVADPRQISGKFLTFFLAEEEYGVEILKVSEIIGLMPITRIPNAPAAARGVVNLRGKVIPIMDLRLKFGMEAVEATDETCIVVVQLDGVKIGLVVDRVSEVMDIRGEEVDPAPSFGGAATEHLLGIAKSEDGVKLLLDIERVLAEAEVAGLGRMLDEEAAE